MQNYNLKRSVLFSFIFILIFALSAIGLAAQGPQGEDRAADAAMPLASELSYQGVLRENNELVTGQRDMIFKFYDDQACSNQIGTDISANGVQVNNGLFSIMLPVDQSLFNGQALWLELNVDAAKINCTKILAAPYALGLKPGAEVESADATSIFRAINTNTTDKTRGLYAKTYATITDTAAVYGHSASATGETFGVYGKTESTGTDAAGVYGVASATSGKVYGLYGYVASPDGRALQAVNDAQSGQARAVYAKNYSPEGQALYAHAGSMTGETYGVYGKADSVDGSGVYGHATSATGATYGVYGMADAATDGSAGVYGTSSYTDTTAKVYGLYGYVNAANGRAVQAVNDAESGQARAVYAKNYSPEGQALYAHAGSTTGDTYGVYAKADSPDGYGVYGYATAASGENYGVYGQTDSPDGYAGYFVGDVHVTGTVSISGELIAASKSFQIDHPLDDNKYLRHASVEAPERLNIYNGNVILDDAGEAVVELPDYFEALNTDFRYQLTPIGQPALLYVAEEVSGNTFKIAGGEAGMKVSWEVTGVRQDDWSEANPLIVEVEK